MPPPPPSAPPPPPPLAARGPRSRLAVAPPSQQASLRRIVMTGDAAAPDAAGAAPRDPAGRPAGLQTVPPPPPSMPPPTPRTDLRSHGFAEDEIAKYRQVFTLLDGDGDGFLTATDLRRARGDVSEEDALWMLKQFAPASADQVDRIDLATFARACAKNRSGAWSDAFRCARKELLRALAEADEPLEEILAEAGIEVTPAEALEMAKVLENEAAFMRAMGVAPSQVGAQRAVSPLVAAASRPAQGMAAVFAAINGGGPSAGPAQTSGKAAPSDLPFFDGTGDPRDLPVASPSLEESEFPPPTPPPLP